MPKAEPLSNRLYRDDAYIAVAKAVRYHELPASDVLEKLQEAIKVHGRSKMDEATKALLDVDGNPPTAKLKAEVRKLCWGLLGPDGGAWDEFYSHLSNPPPNPYKSDVTDALRIEKEKAAESPPPEVESEDFVPRRMVPPPEMTVEEMVRKLPDDELQKLRKDAEAGVEHHGARSVPARGLKRDIAMAEAEQARRREQAGQPSEVDLLRSMHGRKLRAMLLSLHVLFRNHPPGEPTHDEAVSRIELVEMEMRVAARSFRSDRRRSPTASPPEKTECGISKAPNS